MNQVALKREESPAALVIGKMIHDFRSPVTNIALIANTMIEGLAGALTDDQQRMLLRLRRQLGRIESMIDEVVADHLKPNRSKCRKHGPIDVNHLIQESIDNCATDIKVEKHITIHFKAVHTDDEIPGYVVGEATKIARVIDNILHNALKFTPMNGRIEITTTIVDTIRQEHGTRQHWGEAPFFRVAIFNSGSRISRGRVRRYSNPTSS